MAGVTQKPPIGSVSVTFEVKIARQRNQSHTKKRRKEWIYPLNRVAKGTVFKDDLTNNTLVQEL